VRFDGGHKRDRFLTDVLRRHVEFVPVCPEVEMGLGTPREPVRLVRDPRGLRMITVTTNIDHTDAMESWAARRVEELATEHLAGFVLKMDSPSCGVHHVKTYGAAGVVADGRGLFAAALMKRFPDLPVEDEGRLADAAARQAFIERVFAYHEAAQAGLS
jgi:uncharacterized protein YbbK (DUF523 family)